jgi:hypothetical protein
MWINNQYLKLRGNTAWRIIKFIPWFLLAAAVVVRVVYYGVYGKMSLTSDISGWMIFANLLNKEHTILPATNWFYSTEIWLVGVQPFQLGLLLFSDWHQARTFALLLFLLLIIGCYVFFARGAKLSNSGAWTAVVMVSTFGVSSYSMLVLGMMYFVYIMMPLLTFSFAIRIAGNKKWSCLWHVPMILCSVIFAMQGIRVFLVSFLPLFCAAFVLVFLDMQHQEKIPSLRAWIKTWKARCFLVSLETVFLGVIGYLVNVKVLHSFFTFISWETTAFSNFDIGKMFSHVNQIATLLGYCPGVAVFSLDGIRSLCALTLLFLGVLAFVRGSMNWSSLTEVRQLVLAFSFFIIVISIVATSLTGDSTDRYLIPAFLFIFPAMHVAWDAEPFKNRIVKGFFYLVFIGCIFLINSWQIITLAKHTPVTKSGIEQASEWLSNNGYSSGYATFWNAGITTELSNGQLEVWCCSDGSIMEIKEWLQLKTHLTKRPDGRVFVLLSDAENDVKPKYAQKSHMVYHNGGYVIYSYDSSEIVIATPKK